MAFAWFAERAVDVGVVEVGLGGRLDATNAADATVAVVTGISKEHMNVLGSTITEIAREKLGIVKAGSVLVTGPLPGDAEIEAERVTAEVGVQRWKYDRDFSVRDARLAVGGWTVDVDGVFETYEDLVLPLHGRYQTRNLAVAIAAVESLFGRPLDQDALREGVASASSPGRLEVLGHRPLLIVDGSHNEEGMGVLASALDEEFPSMSWTVVFGVLGDKDVDGMFDHLQGIATRLVVTAPESSRAADPSALAGIARQRLGPDTEILVIPGVESAIREALRLTGPDDALIATGSLYLAGEARPILKEVANE
jgi:dihydrofolate synthase/folylpolyglutamate synthase